MRSSSGFTLVEVAVAIAILGIALVSLVGLHTDNVGTYYNERNRIQAALIAKHVMSLIEADNVSPEIGTEEKSVSEVLKELGSEEFGAEVDSKERYDNWEFVRTVKAVDLPLAEDAMRRIDITVSWGESSSEQFVLTYFMRTTPEQ